jgi:hypothetical protein
MNEILVSHIQPLDVFLQTHHNASDETVVRFSGAPMHYKGAEGWKQPSTTIGQLRAYMAIRTFLPLMSP